MNISYETLCHECQFNNIYIPIQRSVMPFSMCHLVCCFYTGNYGHGLSSSIHTEIAIGCRIQNREIWNKNNELTLLLNKVLYLFPEIVHSEAFPRRTFRKILMCLSDQIHFLRHFPNLTFSEFH